MCVVSSEKFCSCCLTCDSVEAEFCFSCNIQWAETSGKDTSCSTRLLLRWFLCTVTRSVLKVSESSPVIKAWGSHSLGKLSEEPEMAPNLNTSSSLLQILHIVNSVNAKFLQWSPNSSYNCQIPKLLPFPLVKFFLICWYSRENAS